MADNPDFTEIIRRYQTAADKYGAAQMAAAAATERYRLAQLDQDEAQGEMWDARTALEEAARTLKLPGHG